MNISEKIEQIRLAPMSVRLRYVWGSVIVSMLFIFIIWLFSMSLLFKGNKNSLNGTSVTPSIKEQFSTVKEQVPSINDLTSKPNNSNNKKETESTESNNKESIQSIAQ
jgi:hypothetical protein